MRIAYLQPVSGISGNMVIGACLDAGVPWDALAGVLEPLAIGPWTPLQEAVLRCGMRGTYFNVDVDDPVYRPGDHSHSPLPTHRYQSVSAPGHAPHRHYPEVVAMVERAGHLSPWVRQLALDTLRRIGEAESALHGIPLSELHLHEIGAMDTIIDVVGSMAALEWLGVEAVYGDAVHVGTGHRTTAHGVVPIPTPATLAILAGQPLVMDRPGFELTTPTGAAILMALLNASGTVGAPPPPGRVVATGWGAGTADLPDRPNLLRLTLLESDAAQLPTSDWRMDERWERDTIVALRANIDDLSPERYPPLVSQLLTMGALDITTTQTIMKGGRPGVQLEVLTPPGLVSVLLARLFEEGISLGFRVVPQDRAVLRREGAEVVLRDGQLVEGKRAWLGETLVREKPEMRAIEAHAIETGQPVKSLIPPPTAERPEANEYGEFDNVEFILSLLEASRPDPPA